MKKGTFFLNYPLFIVVGFLIFAISCKNSDDSNSIQPMLTIPVLATTAVTNITSSMAVSGGNISSDGGAEVTVRGVCWSTSPTPTISDNKTTDGIGTGVYDSNITDLTVNTTYYVRAYATNSKGTSYGKAFSFVTLLGLPEITTALVTNIKQTTATCGGNVTSDGGSAVTARGVCWSTNPTPTISDNKTTDDIGAGVYVSNITDLTVNTTYYVRAYATNSNFTSYGNAVSFITPINIKCENIPAGSFTMGSPTNEVNRGSDETQFKVTLSAFRMSRYETTNSEYATFLNAKGIGSDGKYVAGTYPTESLIVESSGSKDWGLHFTNGQWVPVAGYENYPAIRGNWYGANEFATYVGGRLPTEAEWEYACRAGTTTPFSTGNFLTNMQANYDWGYPYNGGNNTVTTGQGKTQVVGAYTANAYGLYDMHGNVYEWCSDWYGNYPTTAQTNPTGSSTGSYRVLRGGGWEYPAQVCRSAARAYADSNYTGNQGVGFRVVFLP